MRTGSHASLRLGKRVGEPRVVNENEGKIVQKGLTHEGEFLYAALVVKFMLANKLNF